MEEFHWEDAIDIDDADLLNPILPSDNPTNCNPTPLSHSFPSLKPCSQSQSQSQNPNPNPKTPIHSSPPKRPAARPPIPGPAGAVQAAMHRRSSAAAIAAAQSPIFNSQGKQADRRLILEEEGEEEDGDFKLNPWLCAAEFLGRDFDSRWAIDSIKDRRRSDGAVDRIPQVVGVVKSCVPNGLGDLFTTLKDPTGMIGASIHRNVLMENNLGVDLSVGCVIILKQVAVFFPSRSACYLNITTNNMVKLISKDCGPPDKQRMPSSEARHGAAFGKQMEARQGPVEKLTSLRQSEETIALNEVRKEINNGRVLNCRKAGLAESLPHNFTSQDSNVALKSDLRTNSIDSAAKLNRVIATTNMVDNPYPKTNSASNMVGKPDPRGNTAGTVASKSNLRTVSTINAPVSMDTVPDVRSREPTKMIPSISVGQWTDEQLLELFTDYQDDAELVHQNI